VRVMLLMAFSAFAHVGFGRGLATLPVDVDRPLLRCCHDATRAGALNHWDEAVAFGAIFALVSIFNQVTDI
jgi:hypothetical protein